MGAKLEELASKLDEELANIARPKLFGLLNYFRGYVPDFELCLEPIRKLLAKPHLPWPP